MGAVASTNVVDPKLDLISTAYNQCPSVSVSNTITIDNVTFEPNDNCTDSEFLLKQNAGATAECVIGNLQASTADVLSNLSAEAQAGLGLTASTNVADIALQIEQKLENDCNYASAENMAAIKDTVIRACNLRVIQDATAKQSCKINNLQDIAAKVETTAKASSEGLTLANFLGGGLIILIIIIVIVVIIYYFTKGKKTTAAMPISFGGASDDWLSTGPNTISGYFVAAILILVAFIIAFTNKRDDIIVVRKKKNKSIN